ncbi:NAD(P)-dependent oxidoreductase [Variovorax sp. PCZ-1]|uniref:NAD(P)-dependent oxidoreductase n=1 Tax=Variovorax sp. PCZ-1 TaxID=2835533 RepID=UPI001BD040D2|nr:NAD(P)-dependent oxidoreductase [Variovorax sp. PCZ-1]MBS7808332.1 NAD(P)-dependent oxidoreductase [Variovorax sp. PCZ-1]
MRIAFLGIGLMGLPMARRLCEAGFEVHVWNRTMAKAQPLAAHGAKVYADAVQAVAGAEVVVSILEHGQVTESVLFEQGVAKAMKKGALLIDMSSSKPREARDHAARLTALGLHHMDCPVSGGTVGAENGTLVMMAGGLPADYERAQPVLKVFGRSTHVGPHGAGQLTKLANQMIVGGTIGVVAEALLLASRGGADMAKVREAMLGGFADSRILQLHGDRMANRDFAPRGRLAVQLKDMRNAVDCAQETGMDAPIVSFFEQLYSQAEAHGLGELDHSGLFVELASRNGMS